MSEPTFQFGLDPPGDQPPPSNPALLQLQAAYTRFQELQAQAQAEGNPQLAQQALREYEQAYARLAEQAANPQPISPPSGPPLSPSGPPSNAPPPSGPPLGAPSSPAPSVPRAPSLTQENTRGNPRSPSLPLPSGARVEGWQRVRSAYTDWAILFLPFLVMLYLVFLVLSSSLEVLSSLGSGLNLTPGPSPSPSPSMVPDGSGGLTPAPSSPPAREESELAGWAVLWAIVTLVGTLICFAYEQTRGRTPGHRLNGLCVVNKQGVPFTEPGLLLLRRFICCGGVTLLIILHSLFLLEPLGEFFFTNLSLVKLAPLFIILSYALAAAVWFLPAFFDKQARAPHDMICGSKVVGC